MSKVNRSFVDHAKRAKAQDKALRDQAKQRERGLSIRGTPLARSIDERVARRLQRMR